MNDEQKVLILAHPFIAATVPGVCAFGIGLVAATCGSVMGYQFVYMFGAIDNLDSDLTYPVAFNLAIPLGVFLCMSHGRARVDAILPAEPAQAP